MPTRHGTRSKYNEGCHCPMCSRANSDYQRIWGRGTRIRLDGRMVYVGHATYAALKKLDRLSKGETP